MNQQTADKILYWIMSFPTHYSGRYLVNENRLKNYLYSLVSEDETANTTEDERHTGNPVCPRCTVDCIQNVDGDWICDCHTTEDEPVCRIGIQDTCSDRMVCGDWCVNWLQED